MQNEYLNWCIMHTDSH